MTNQKIYSFEFDNFRVDLTQKCLWYGSNVIPLTPKAFDTLVVLMESKGKLVEKETLLNKVWENTFVEEATLSQNISTLRKALNYSKNDKQYIETVPRRGFRFLGDIHEITDEENLLISKRFVKPEMLIEQENFDISNTKETNIKTKAESVRKFYKYPFAKTTPSVVIAQVTICLGILAGIGIYYFFLSKLGEKFTQIEINQLTSRKNVSKMAVSPDQKLVALVEKRGDDQTLLLKEVGNLKTIEIIPPTTEKFIGVTFSPDNKYIYYVAYQKIEAVKPYSIGTLYKVPVSGGIRQELIKDIDSSVAFSPDNNNKFAFVRQSSLQQKSSIIIFNCSEAGEVTLASRQWGERFSSDGLTWSPDGKFVASAAYEKNDSSSRMRLIIVNTRNGSQEILSSQSFAWIGEVAWLKDGSSIIFPVSLENSSSAEKEIWKASYPEGNAQHIKKDINGYDSLLISARYEF